MLWWAHTTFPHTLFSHAEKEASTELSWLLLDTVLPIPVVGDV